MMHSNKWKTVQGMRNQREQFKHLSPSLTYRLNYLFHSLKGSSEFDPWGSWVLNESIVNQLRINLAVLEGEVETIRKFDYSEYTLCQLTFLRLNIIDSFINTESFDTLNQMKKFKKRSMLSDDEICDWLLKFQRAQTPKQKQIVIKHGVNKVRILENKNKTNKKLPNSYLLSKSSTTEFVTGEPPFGSPVYLKKTDKVKVGDPLMPISNPSYFCAFISAIQLILHAEYFVNHTLSIDYTNVSGLEFISELQNLYAIMTNKNKRNELTNKLKNFVKVHFSSFMSKIDSEDCQEQDVAEVVSDVIAKLKTKGSDFNTLVKHEIICRSCNTTTTKYIEETMVRVNANDFKGNFKWLIDKKNDNNGGFCQLCNNKLLICVSRDPEKIAAQLLIHVDRNFWMKGKQKYMSKHIDVKENIEIPSHSGVRCWRLDGLVLYKKSSRHYMTLEREGDSWFKFDDSNKSKSSIQGCQFSDVILLSYSEVKKRHEIKEFPVSQKSTKTIINAVGQEFYIPIIINKHLTIDALYDTGANCTIISIKDFNKLAQETEIVLNQNYTSAGICANGSEIKSIGEITIEIDIGKQSFGILSANVCDIEHSIVGTNLILGDHVRSLKLSKLDISGGKLTWVFNNDQKLELQVFSKPLSCNARTYKIAAIDSCTIPPRSKRNIPCRVIGIENIIGLLEEKTDIQINKGNYEEALMVENYVADMSKDQHFHAKRINWGDKYFKIRKDQIIGRVVVSHNEGSTNKISSIKSRLNQLYDLLDIENVLPKEEWHRARQFLEKYGDSIAIQDDDLTQTTVTNFSIDTGDAKPINIPTRRTPLALKDEYKKQIDHCLKTGVMIETCSPWSAPALMVKKPNNSWRLCVDYRKLNDVIKSDAYPLPNMEEMIDQLQGKQIFSCIDLLSGFWQIPVDKETQDKLAFSTPFGQFTWNVMPFGIKTAPATFQRMMDFVLNSNEDKDTKAFLDDVTLATEDWESHWLSLENLFKKLKSANLKVKAEKFKLGRKEVQFLGHTIAYNTISPGGKNREALLGLKTLHPTKMKDIERIFGVLNWSRKFIMNFAEKAEPISRLLKFRGVKGLQIKKIWNEEAENARQNLIEEILKPDTMLNMVDMEKKFVLVTDASGVACGAHLYQESNGEKETIGYHSKIFQGAERNYPIREKEMLALVEATKRFQPYLAGGKRFTWITDNQSLLNPKYGKTQHAFYRITGWIEHLNNFDYDIQLRSGNSEELVVADALSRIPGGCGQIKEHIINMVCINDMVKLADIEEGQRNDTKIKEILRKVRLDKMESYGTYHVRDNILRYRKKIKHFNDDIVQTMSLPVIPNNTQMRNKLIDNIHNQTHPGINETIRRLKNICWWRGIRKYVTERINSCESCLLIKSDNKPMKPIVKTDTSEIPFKKVQLDLTGPYSISGKRDRLKMMHTDNEIVTWDGEIKKVQHCYLMAFVDTLSKFTILIPMSRKTHEESRLAVEKAINRVKGLGYGVEVIQTDRGNEFFGSFDKYLKDENIEHVRSAGYRPQSQGLVERLNRFVKEKIRLSKLGALDWDKGALEAEYEINNHKHKVTGFTPNEIIRPDITDVSDMIEGDEFWLDQKREMSKYFSEPLNREKIINLTYERVHQEKDDRFLKSKPVRIQDIWSPSIGDKVCLKLYGQEKTDLKVQERQRYTGPFIIEKTNKAVTRVQDRQGNVCEREVVVAVVLRREGDNRRIFRHANISDIRPYKEREDGNLILNVDVEEISNDQHADYRDLITNSNNPLIDEIEMIRTNLEKKKMVNTASNVTEPRSDLNEDNTHMHWEMILREAENHNKSKVGENMPSVLLEFQESKHVCSNIGKSTGKACLDGVVINQRIKVESISESWKIRHSSIWFLCKCMVFYDDDSSWYGNIWVADWVLSEFGYANNIINPNELNTYKILDCQLSTIDADKLVIWRKTHEQRSMKGVVYIGYIASHGNDSQENNSFMIWVPNKLISFLIECDESDVDDEIWATRYASLFIDNSNRDHTKSELSDAYGEDVKLELDRDSNSDLNSNLDAKIRATEPTLQQDVSVVIEQKNEDNVSTSKDANWEVKMNYDLIPEIVLANLTLESMEVLNMIDYGINIWQDEQSNYNGEYQKKLKARYDLEQNTSFFKGISSKLQPVKKRKLISELITKGIKHSSPELTIMILDYRIKVWEDEVVLDEYQLAQRRKYDVDNGTDYFKGDNKIRDIEEILDQTQSSFNFWNKCPIAVRQGTVDQSDREAHNLARQVGISLTSTPKDKLNKSGSDTSITGGHDFIDKKTKSTTEDFKRDDIFRKSVRADKSVKPKSHKHDLPITKTSGDALVKNGTFKSKSKAPNRKSSRQIKEPDRYSYTKEENRTKNHKARKKIGEG